jgi:PAS domain S-box-containing protein
MLENAFSSAMWSAGFYAEAPLAIALVDLRGRFVDCNTSFAELLGYTTQELERRTKRDITHPECWAGTDAAYKAASRDSSRACTFHSAIRLIHKSGAQIWVTQHTRALWTEQQQFVGFLVHCVPMAVTGTVTIKTPSDQPDQHIEVHPALTWFDLVRQNPWQTLVALSGLVVFLGHDHVMELLKLVIGH